MRTIRSILAVGFAAVTLGACGSAETRSTSATRPQTTPAVTAAPTRVSDTYSYTEPRRPLTLADSIQVCREVQRSRRIPITCQTTYVEGRPTMVVGFPGPYEYDTYGRVIVEYVAAPFCEAANNGNREAFLVFAVSRPDLMRLYSCETGEITQWFDPKSLRSS